MDTEAAAKQNTAKNAESQVVEIILSPPPGSSGRKKYDTASAAVESTMRNISKGDILSSLIFSRAS